MAGKRQAYGRIQYVDDDDNLLVSNRAPTPGTATSRVTTGDAAPVMSSAAGASIYKVELTPDGAPTATGCIVQFFQAVSTTADPKPVAGLRITVDFTAAAYTTGWTRSVYCVEDVRVGVQISAITGGGTAHVDVNEVLT